MIKVKRIYDPASRDDGARILVDRLWPRGISREKAAIDEWMRDIAPSRALRTWFRHDPAKWNEFCRRYAKELDDKAAQLTALKVRAADGRVTLLYGAKDPRHNNAAT